MSEVNRDFGWEIFQGALVHYARNKAPQEMRRKYLADKEDYQNCVRVQDFDSLNCWYGYIYTLNDSAYTLRETINLELQGIKALEPSDF